jgi:multicomponent Na+:H+ antiporter subunit G
VSAVVADALTVLGLVVLTVGVYGVLRLPDVQRQVHAASKAGYVGVVILLAAAAVRGDGAVVARAILIVALLTLTTPVAAHAVARAAHRREWSERPGEG